MSESDLQEAIALFEYWGEGYGEYVCWDVLQGYREKPCAFTDGLTDEQFALLERLSDQHRVWLQFIKKKWKTVPIEEWRKHTLNLRADEVCRRLEFEGTVPHGR